MLTDPSAADDSYFEALRAREFARLDDAGLAYLDLAGSALYTLSQVRAYADLLASGVFGNPHSGHQPSRDSTDAIEAARNAVLAFLGLDAATHTICFTANTSAAIKLVAEAYPFGPRRAFVQTADNHNSVNGIREFARASGAPIRVLPLGADLRLSEPKARLEALAGLNGGLFAFPAQSNFSGVRHPLELVTAAQTLGLEVLIDAAGLPWSALRDLGSCTADFIAFSFYKLFGLPTGVGALIARNEALPRLRRPWFAGGTVDFVSVELDRHQLQRGAEGFEDGTPNFLSLAAVPFGIHAVEEIGSERASRRLAQLTRRLLGGLQGLRHSDGAPRVEIYGPQHLEQRGATVAFNLLDPIGKPISYAPLERAARDAGLAIRGGCFCNPGAAESAFGFEGPRVSQCLDRLSDNFTIPEFAKCLGQGTAVGALRISLGCPTTAQDVDRALQFCAANSAL